MTRAFGGIVACAIGISAGAARPSPAVKQTSSSASPLSIVILVDVTASLHRAVAGVAGLPSTAPTATTGRGISRPDRPIPPAVEEFVLEGLRADDRVRVGAIGRTLTLSPRFTTDVRERHAAWHDAFERPPIDWLGPSPLWDALFEATQVLANEPGRRAIVLVTDGEASGNVHGSREVADLAARAGVSVSVVAEEAVLSQAPLTPMSAVGIDPTKALRAIADRTGGVFVLDRAVPDTAWPGTYFKRDARGCLRAVLDRLHGAASAGD